MCVRHRFSRQFSQLVLSVVIFNGSYGNCEIYKFNMMSKTLLTKWCRLNSIVTRLQ